MFNIRKSNLIKSFAFVLTALATSLSAASQPIEPVKEVFSPPSPAHPEQFMKVAVVQWNSAGATPLGASAAEAGAYMDRNRADMAARIQTAAANGALFISLSEFAVVGYPDIPNLPPEEDDFRNRDDIRPFVDTIPGLSTQYFSALAKAHKVWIQFGMAEVETGTDKYFNTAVVINDSGEIVATFRKNSLYQLENNFLSAGSKAVTFEAPFGRVGLVICADIYNQTLLSQYRALGVNVLSLSTSWAQMNTGMSVFSSAARSMGVYVLAANQTYFPDSGVINADGTQQSHIRQSLDQIAYGYLPLKNRAAPAPAATPQVPASTPVFFKRPGK